MDSLAESATFEVSVSSFSFPLLLPDLDDATDGAFSTVVKKELENSVLKKT